MSKADRQLHAKLRALQSQDSKRAKEEESRRSLEASASWLQATQKSMGMGVRYPSSIPTPPTKKYLPAPGVHVVFGKWVGSVIRKHTPRFYRLFGALGFFCEANQHWYIFRHKQNVLKLSESRYWRAGVCSACWVSIQLQEEQ